jgi:hypothetical protein
MKILGLSPKSPNIKVRIYTNIFTVEGPNFTLFTILSHYRISYSPTFIHGQLWLATPHPQRIHLPPAPKVKGAVPEIQQQEEAEEIHPRQAALRAMNFVLACNRLVANWMAPGDLLVYECPADTSSRFF